MTLVEEDPEVHDEMKEAALAAQQFELERDASDVAVQDKEVVSMTLVLVAEDAHHRDNATLLDESVAQSPSSTHDAVEKPDAAVAVAVADTAEDILFHHNHSGTNVSTTRVGVLAPVHITMTIRFLLPCISILCGILVLIVRRHRRRRLARQ